MTSVINVLICLAVMVGIVLLQIFLSKKERPWPGLIMPILYFLAVLVIVLGNIDILLVNIPTFIMLAIYFACRGKRRHKKQLEKMNIQDLD